MLLVLGAPGSEEYGRRFQEVVEQWREACKKAGAQSELIGGNDKQNDDAKRLESRLQAEHAKTTGALWLVLIGHGTYDGREAKFNLRGDDLTATQLAAWLKPVKRELVFIATASASAPFAKALAGPNRVCISATKSADEIFYARFGEYFAKAINNKPEADIDQDLQVSVLEAFLAAAKQADEFYVTDGRLATEHAIIDDNGDGIGTCSELFKGVTPGETKDGAKADGDRARQLALVLSPDEALLTDDQRRQRDELERTIRALSGRKAQMGDSAYYAELERLMLALAKIYKEEKLTQPIE